MARLIVKSPYINCGGGQSAGGYLNYIGTREHVEILPDDRPPTRKQEQLIQRLTSDYPDTKKLPEYEDYASEPTKYRASAFITTALEEHWDDAQRSEVYMKYIATRPRAERFGDHGLFGDEDKVDLSRATEELEQYTGNVWIHIISLQREDAERLGYDSAKSWQNLFRTHRNEIAEAMHIPPRDFRWYAAFHNEGDHPHCHLMAWSVKPGQAYLDKDGIRKIKSELTNDIFRQEMLHLYEQKSMSRDELVREARRELMKLVQAMRQGIVNHPAAEQLMSQLADQLGSVKGKKSYSYLPKPQKKLVDEIVDQMERVPVVAECYDRWWQLQSQVMDFYSEKARPKLKLSQQKEFRQIKNAVIQEAERIRLGEVTFEDRGMDQQDEPEQFSHSSRYFDDLWEIIRDDSLTMEEREGAVEEMEALAKAGDTYAQYAMGILYCDGPLLIPNAVEARHWLSRAAQAKNPAAQYALGKILLSDDPEVQHIEQGLLALKIAARNGNHYAAYRLGKEYLTGEHVPKDTAKAMECFTQSAKQGNPYAQYMLGKLYLTGQDVPLDKELGVYWLTLASQQGNQYAQLLLARQDSQHAPSVILAATQLLYHMSKIFQDNSLPQSLPGGMRIDRKRWEEIIERRLASGQALDDHEDPEMNQASIGGMGGMSM